MKATALFLVLFLGLSIAFEFNGAVEKTIQKIPKSFDSKSQAARHVLKNLLKSKELGKFKSGITSLSSSSIKRGVSADCQAKLTALTTLVSSPECEGITNFFETGGKLETLNSTSLASYLSQICTATTGCIAKIQNTLVDISSACPIDTFDGGPVKSLLVFLSVPCIKDGNEYCILKVRDISKQYEILQQTSTDNFDLTTEILDTLCHPCIQQMAVLLAEFGVENFASALDLVCLKDEGKYCVISLRDAFSGFDEFAEGPEQMGKILVILCENRCFGKYIAAILAFNQSDVDGAQLAALFGAFCIKDNDGKYCALTLFSVVEEAPQNCDFGPTCSSQCKKEASPYMKKLGCCFASFLKITEGLFQSDEEDDGFDANAIRDFIENKCGVSIPPPCQPKRKILVSLTIGNLKFDFVNQNQDLVKNLLRLDIALSAGAPSEAVTILSFQQVDKGVQFSVEIVIDNDNIVSETSSALNDPESYSFPQLSTLPSSAKVDPLAPMEADSASAKAVSNTASGVILSTLLISLSFVFVLLF